MENQEIEKQEIVSTPASPHSPMLPLILVGIFMLFVGLAGGYLLFANKSSSKNTISNQVIQVSPSTTQEIPSPTMSTNTAIVTNWNTFTGKYYSLQYPVSGWTFTKTTDTPADQDWIDITLNSKKASIHGSVNQLLPKGFTFSQIIGNDKEFLTNPKQESITIPAGQAIKVSGLLNDKSRSDDIGKSSQIIYIEKNGKVIRLAFIQNLAGEYDKTFNQLINTVKTL